MATPRILYPSAQPVYAAAAEWRDQCLIEDGSLFSPGMTLGQGPGSALMTDFVENPDTGTDDFLTKLRGQLGGAGAAEAQLAAELLYVHLLIAWTDSVSGARKREIVSKVLAFASGTAQLPEHLGRVLDAGLARPGQAFNTYRWKQFGLLVRFYVTMKALDVAARRQVLADPAQLVALLAAIPEPGSHIQRNALMHLLFPDTFPAMVSREHRELAINCWPALAGSESTPEPLRLAAVVGALAPNQSWDGQAFTNVYRSPYWWQWTEPGAQWRVFLSWGSRLLEHVDLDAEEHTYKREISRHLVDARAKLAGGLDWGTPLLAALRKSNLVSWQVVDVFVGWAEDQPGAAAKALRELWDDPSSAAVDRFAALLPESLPTLGAQLSLASFLLGAADVERFPMWRAQAIDKAYQLTSFARAQAASSAGEQYDRFLEFLDLIVDSSPSALGGRVTTRLEAQGLMWALLTHTPDSTWPEEERAAFLSWRGNKGTTPPQAQAVTAATAAVSVAAKPGTSEDDVLALTDLAATLYLEERFLEETVTLLRDPDRSSSTGRREPGRRSSRAGWLGGWPAARPECSWCSSIRRTATRTSSKVSGRAKTPAASVSSRAPCSGWQPRPMPTPRMTTSSSSTRSTAATSPACSGSCTSCWSTGVRRCACSTPRSRFGFLPTSWSSAR